jgi:hypothetical protein
VRRYLRWYINPIVEQQNAYNDAIARALRLLADAYADLGQQLAEHSSPEGRGGSGGTAEAASTSAGRPTMDDGRWTMDNTSTQQSVAPSEHSHISVHETMAFIRERAGAEPPASFPDLELRRLEPHLRLRQNVSAHWPLTGATLAQRLMAAANKLVRRYLRWYINPIVEQQNAANASITAAMLALVRLDAERRAQVAGLRAQSRRQGD